MFLKPPADGGWLAPASDAGTRDRHPSTVAVDSSPSIQKPKTALFAKLWVVIGQNSGVRKEILDFPSKLLKMLEKLGLK